MKETKDLVSVLKNLIEGQMPIQEWEEWWRVNEKIIESRENKLAYLLLKRKPIKGASHGSLNLKFEKRKLSKNTN
jgi:hypothetical protein